mmetsp:Transcript_24665/g.51260  ORF Transcript_24665/g.51260 Transcript_24665/m.51260 type:complete len:423 (+) Transcript_24665:294-1562(+)
MVLVALVLLPILEQVKLSQHLVGEGARHDEGGMACGTAQVQEPAGGENDDTVAIWEYEAVNLCLDVLHLDARHSFQLSHLNLVVEVANVADDGIVLHLFHMLQSDDLEVARGRRKNIHLPNYGLQSDNLEALHARLKRADWVNLGNQDTGSGSAHGKGTALADIAIAADQGALAPNHDICGTHDAVRQRVTAPVHIIELGLCHAVVHIDGGEEQLPLGSHLLQPVHTSGGLLANTMASLGHPGELGLVRWDGILQQLQDAFEFRIIGAGRVGQGPILGVLLLELLALVDQQRRIATIIHEQVAAVGTRHCHHLLSAPPVLRKSLPLPCEDRRSAGLGNGCSRMVLSAEDVARAPADRGAHGSQGLNQNTRLDGHVQRAVDVQALEWLTRTELLPAVHKPRHLMLGKRQLLTSELSEAHVLHL